MFIHIFVILSKGKSEATMCFCVVNDFSLLYYWFAFHVTPCSNNQIILGENNANVPRILLIIGEVCAEDALEDNEQVYLRLLSIARHIQVKR